MRGFFPFVSRSFDAVVGIVAFETPIAFNPEHAEQATRHEHQHRQEKRDGRPDLPLRIDVAPMVLGGPITMPAGKLPPELPRRR